MSDINTSFTIHAYPVDHPQFGRFWRSYVTCCHGLMWLLPIDPKTGWPRTEQETLRAAALYRDEVRQWCSDATCQAVHARADAPSATANVTVNPYSGEAL